MSWEFESTDGLSWCLSLSILSKGDGLDYKGQIIRLKQSVNIFP